MCARVPVPPAASTSASPSSPSAAGPARRRTPREHAAGSTRPVRSRCLSLVRERAGVRFAHWNPDVEVNWWAIARRHTSNIYYIGQHWGALGLMASIACVTLSAHGGTRIDPVRKRFSRCVVLVDCIHQLIYSLLDGQTRSFRGLQTSFFRKGQQIA